MRWRKLLHQFPVLSGLARCGHHRTRDLHLAIGVGECAPFFRMGGGGEHHVCVPGRLCQEDVLNNKMLQPGQRRSGVMLVRVGHGRVFAENIHGLDLVAQDGVDDFNNGQSLDRRQVVFQNSS